MPPPDAPVCNTPVPRVQCAMSRTACPVHPCVRASYVNDDRCGETTLFLGEVPRRVGAQRPGTGREVARDTGL